MTYAPVVTALCRDCGWPVPVAEYRFDPVRRWRFDLAWPDHALAVEIEGGLFTGGRHVQGAALIREYEKLNAATLAGWAVLLVVPRQITSGALSALLGAYFAGARVPKDGPASVERRGFVSRSRWECGE